MLFYDAGGVVAAADFARQSRLFWEVFFDVSYPDDLTQSQWQAVDHLEGPLLVLAGPGSGKTRVITRRIARMIDRGVDPREILAITFTNKAATEMATRIAAILPERHVWTSTFHKLCSRLLRRWGEAVGIKQNFTIYDTTDQRQLLRHVLHELDIDAVHYSPARIAACISNAKNAMQTAEIFARQFEESIGDHFQAVVARVFPEYQKQLLKANAVDFDDLLLHVVTLLSENPELRRELDERFRFILVDEYQDTNMAQYQIVAALSQDHPHLCVTGDPDQSIYGWRGARIENILRFEAEFPNAKTVRLEDNFRSTKQILRAADRLISHNTQRKIKALVTDNPEGSPVELLCMRDARDEAEKISTLIREQVDSGSRQWSDFAVFYRVNALSREIEVAMSRYRIPYQVAGGVAFYQRAEVKDVLAYLRLVYNPDDETAFRRIINKPARGIGKKTVSKLADWANSQSFNLLEAASRANLSNGFSKRAANSLNMFSKLIENFSLADTGSVECLLTTIVERTRYTASWVESPLEEDQQRLANVQELINAARQYDEAFPDDPSLEGFLESCSLASEVDNLDQESGQVTLMTLHASKGLEFPVVYIVGVEQNLIPHERSLRSGDLRELEEERRLLFVGMTRAMQELYLTQTKSRQIRGRSLHTIPSDFLMEIPRKVTDFENFDEQSATNWPDFSADMTEDEIDSQSSRPLLMTGADLLNGTASSADVPQGFAVGETVRHPRYGIGTVTGVSGFSKRRTVTVDFHESSRCETFVAAKSPLQPVGAK